MFNLNVYSTFENTNAYIKLKCFEDYKFGIFANLEVLNLNIKFITKLKSKALKVFKDF